MRNVNDYYDGKFRDFIRRVESEDRRRSGGCRPLALAALLCIALGACHPKFVIPDVELPEVCIPVDTVVEVRERVVTDTIVFAPEWVVLHDTVACPPGLARDSIVYRTKKVLLPGDTVFVARIERDTVRVERQVVHNITGGVGSPSWWLGLAALVAAIITAWRVAGKAEKKQP